MGVPTSEVGYTSAMPRREDHEVHKDMWGIGGGKKKNLAPACFDPKIIFREVPLFLAKVTFLKKECDFSRNSVAPWRWS